MKVCRNSAADAADGLLLMQVRGDRAAATLPQTRRQHVQMLHRRRRAVDSWPGHVYRTAADQIRLDILPLQRRPEDVRTTLGISVVLHDSSLTSPTTSIISTIISSTTSTITRISTTTSIITIISTTTSIISRIRRRTATTGG